MKKETILKYAFLATTSLIIIGFNACKKNKGSEPEGQRSELSKDSIFLYAKQVYFWNGDLPSYETFNPRQYTSGATDLENYNKELFAITRYATNPSTNIPYEYNSDNIAAPKYSNIQDVKDKNPVAVIAPLSSVNIDGVGYDLGILTFGLSADAIRSNYKLYIKAVFPGSSADAKGLTRGTQITAINGIAIGNNFDEQVDLINSLLNNSTASAIVSGIKTNGDPFTYTLTRTSYNSSPIYKSKIFDVGGKKIGYLSYARFSQLSNFNMPSDNYLDPVFSSFAAQGITDLIIDLRYNGGGYVNTAEYLINLIAPSGASGVMYTEVYNTTMQNGNAAILSHQPLTDAAGKIRYSNGKMLNYANVSYTVADNTALFSKKGSLSGVRNVVFIVSENTASASELTINCLKPVVNVKLVGSTTYGKPVGFFPVTIENRYDVYFSMFETRNSRGEGGYYSGLAPDVLAPFDDATLDFDNPQESFVKKAIETILTPKSAVSNSRSVNSVKTNNASNESTNMMNSLNSLGVFKGMIENRHGIK